MSTEQAQLSATFLPSERRVVERRNYLAMGYGALFLGLLMWVVPPFTGSRLMFMTLTVALMSKTTKFAEDPRDNEELQALKAEVAEAQAAPKIAAQIGGTLALVNFFWPLIVLFLVMMGVL